MSAAGTIFAVKFSSPSCRVRQIHHTMTVANLELNFPSIFPFSPRGKMSKTRDDQLQRKTIIKACMDKAGEDRVLIQASHSFGSTNKLFRASFHLHVKSGKVTIHSTFPLTLPLLPLCLDISTSHTSVHIGLSSTHS